MRVRAIYSCKQTRRARDPGHTGKERKKYPALAQEILNDSDIVLQVLDARFPEKTRNLEFEEQCREAGRKLIYVLNKSDLVKTSKLRKIDVKPNVTISCTERRGIRTLRSLIKIETKRVRKKNTKIGKYVVGIVGYPNVGKSTLINLLIGRSSAGVGSEAGFTRGIQKLKLDEETVLLDSPGVIPDKDYSTVEFDKMAKHTIVGGKSFSQVNDPDLVVAAIMRDFPCVLEDFYDIESLGDSEVLLETLGRKRGYLKKGDEVEIDKVSRLILKDWQTGKIKV